MSEDLEELYARIDDLKNRLSVRGLLLAEARDMNAKYVAELSSRAEQAAVQGETVGGLLERVPLKYCTQLFYRDDQWHCGFEDYLGPDRTDGQPFEVVCRGDTMTEAITAALDKLGSGE